MPAPALTLLGGVRWQGRGVSGARSQRLLALLVGAAPQGVSAGRLIEEVWADGAPEHPEKALQVLVSRTRARTTADVVEHTGTGYRLGLRTDEVDVLQLRQWVADARRADAAGDVELVRRCAELAVAVEVPASDDPVTGDVLTVAREARDEAAGLLGGALLASGDHERAFSLLEPLAAVRATDEHLLAQVLRAEAGARGVAAALERYAAYAEASRARVGAEPGEPLRRLHAELLARDAPVRDGLKYDAAPMIGRDADVTAIRVLLDHARVVSIVGPGGLGKTRMAHLVGHLAEQPVVQLVELAGVNAPDGVLPEIATVLGVRDSVTTTRHAMISADLRARIAQQLVGAPTLLIVDNCEHLVETVADAVAFLVATVPELRVLTTSRAPLGIAAEQVYQLPQLEERDAVELFRRRAAAARPGVRLDDAEVARLVGRLDGLPLAIELAAAKVRAMSVADVSRRLEDRFALLRGGDRSAPDRHRTLEAVIDWSWQLLPDAPREALRLLSVFPDGFSMAGADAVLGRDSLADITHLAEQSLVVVREDDDLRYRFLETVREYAGYRLGESGEREQAERRLVAWAVATARDLGRGLRGPEQVATMRAARVEAGNLSGVLRSALNGKDRPTVVAVVATMTTFWTIQGDHANVFALAEPVLDLLADHDIENAGPEEAEELRSVLAGLAFGTAILSGRAPQRSLEQLRALGPGPAGSNGSATSRVLQAVFDRDTSGLAALEELSSDPDPSVAQTAMMWLCQLQENSGELEAATATAERALARVDDSVGPWMRAMLESQLAGLAIQAGHTDRALECARRALPIMDALHAFEDTVQLRSAIALAELVRGEVELASQLIEEVAADERARSSLGWIFGSTGMAEVALARGDLDRGLDLYRESVAAARDRAYPWMSADVALAPWVLFTEAACLLAHVQHDRRDAASDLAEGVAGSLSRLLEGRDDLFLDIPVVGVVMVAVAQWLLTDGSGTAHTEAAVRMLALGDRFGYYRGIPSMSWQRASELAERRAPGVLDPIRAEYAGRQVAHLADEAATVVQRALTAL